VELEPGNVYRRYVADDLVDIEVLGHVAPEPFAFRAEWLGLLLAGLLGAAAVLAWRRGPSGKAKAPRAPRSREELVLAIARLDEEFEGGGEASPETRESYQSKRQRLLAELRRRS
jgi:hypothetical protein